MGEFLDKLRTHWFLISAFAMITSAWGADHVKLASLEDYVKKQSEISRDVEDLKRDGARIDERTRMMLFMMEEQNRLSKELLKNQKEATESDKKDDKKDGE